MTTTDPELEIRFRDNLMPKAVAGVYTFRAEQELTHNDSDVTGGEVLRVEEQYEIRAVRFVLDESSVHALYPGAGASGPYSRVLPHITLDRAILPWERRLLGRSDRPQWLALLVFGEGELPDDPQALGLTVTRTVAKLRAPDEARVKGPELSDLGIGPTIQQSPCQTLDVPAALFTAIVPREDELPHLAHVRDVRTVAQRRDDDPEVLTEGMYSVLTANRFPRAPGSYAVHLASLEGFKDRLGPDGPGPNTDAVRLCVLKSWSFTNDPVGTLNIPALFAGLAEPGYTNPEPLNLRLNPAAPSGTPGESERYARERLRLGYVPVPYRMPSGELTYAWYRGPFTPITAPEPPVVGETGHTTADHALIYETQHGLFDIGYAAAYTLGRTLALADPVFTEEVTRARRELANKAVEMMAFGAEPMVSDSGASALARLAEPGFGEGLLQTLAAPAVTGRSTPRPATRRPRLGRVQARATLNEPRRQQLLRATAIRGAPTVPVWLDELESLRRVPFSYLVPHPELLPPESLRLFRVDEAWIEALIAGAIDVGIHTSLDERLHNEFRAGIAGVRNPARPKAGLLIRSALIEQLPEFDMVINAGGLEINELRHEHVAPDTLLCLFDLMPDEIIMREPGQGIHFGLDHGEVITLRDLTPGDGLGHSLERNFPATGSVIDSHVRQPVSGRRPVVLKLTGSGGLIPALATEFPGTDMSPGAFAIQLVNTPVEQRFIARNNADSEDRP
ncbi:hypothetical protein OH799_02695 [Nocardia sp. NBC_00881]|uniref:hypothetical protein n=1 Tax=Nocardia sp. NBC_00881 TaxID=2975995 RepID=UPI00386FEC3E|nr:hypothetical protein OH799_02695 [Nocardia sp. NBC_00881]